LAKFTEKSSLTYKEINFSWGKKLYIQQCSRKQKRSGIAWLLAGVWQLKGVRQNSDNGGCPLCLEEQGVKHISLDCRDTWNWRLKLLYDKWLRINKEVPYKKMLSCTKKDQLKNLGKYLDTVKCNWFNKTKKL
jgi:hypothetical protein